LEESSRHCPIFVHTDRQTNRLFVFIYQNFNNLQFWGFENFCKQLWFWWKN
jgi:hypothetical protein